MHMACIGPHYKALLGEIILSFSGPFSMALGGRGQRPKKSKAGDRDAITAQALGAPPGVRDAVRCWSFRTGKCSDPSGLWRE
jgi:hypothetical protein